MPRERPGESDRTLISLVLDTQASPTQLVVITVLESIIFQVSQHSRYVSNDGVPGSSGPLSTLLASEMRGGEAQTLLKYTC